MRNLATTILMATGILAAASPGLAASARWEVVPGEGSLVEFTSKAALESFTGRTRQVSGGCTFDIDLLSGAVVLEVAVDMASLDTGISLRNRHMRQNHLDTERFPTSWLRGGTVRTTSAPDLPVGGSVSVELLGELDLHGVRRPLSCAVTLSRPTEDTLTAVAEFNVSLADHAIPRPRMLLMKLAEEQRVRVKLALRRAS